VCVQMTGGGWCAVAQSAKPGKAGTNKAEQTSIQIGNKKWYGKGTTYQAHHDNKLHGAGFQPSTMDNVPALQDHGKLTQRQCDGPDDPMLTHAQMQFYAKKAVKVTLPHRPRQAPNHHGGTSTGQRCEFPPRLARRCATLRW